MKTSFPFRLHVTSMLIAACSIVACSKNGSGPSAQSPEKQSDAEYDLARDYFYKGQPRAALDHALKSVEHNDENSKALYFTSTLYLWFCSGQEQQLKAPDCRLPVAEDYARRALKVDETFRDARNLLGQVLILEKKYEDAITTLIPLANDPAYSANYLAWGNLGWAQVLNGALDAGITSLKNSVHEPRFCVGFYRLGLAYEKRGELALAESNFSHALEVDSPDCQNLQDAWEARARVRMKLGRIADARSDLEHCRDISSESQTGRACMQMLAVNSGTNASTPKN